VVSAVGALNGWTLVTAEVSRAPADDGLFPGAFGWTGRNGNAWFARRPAEAWIRVGLLAFFLIAGTIAAVAAGGWVHQAGVPRPAPGPHRCIPSGRSCPSRR
jgi:hypothetical protein